MCKVNVFKTKILNVRLRNDTDIDSLNVLLGGCKIVPDLCINFLGVVLNDCQIYTDLECLAD